MPRRVIHDGRNTLQLHFPFDPALLPKVKGIAGRQWNGAEKYWTVPDVHVVAVVNLLLPENFQLCDATRRLYQERGGALDLDAVAKASVKQALSVPERATGTSVEPKGKPADFTVSRLNQEVRTTLKNAFRTPIWLVGEISGFNKKAHKSTVGFQLIERDRRGNVVAEIAATLFEDSREEIEEELRSAGSPFRIEDEVQVRVCGRVDLYVPWGEYRVVIDSLDIDFTLGEAARRRDEIRRQLVAEGILDQNLALPDPALPLRVGLVTSLGSDAYNDVLQTLRSSGFAFKVTVHGARVQGRQTEPSVSAAMSWFRDRFADFDVVMICRGGGSRTDLGWFDSLVLARMVATFPIPVVIGIGHEKDISALDFVGRSQKTPTAAAEWVVGKVRSASDRIEGRLLDVLRGARQSLGEARSDVSGLVQSLPRAANVLLDRRLRDLREAARQIRRGARRELASESDRLETFATQLVPRSAKMLATEMERLEARSKRLSLLEPRRVIERGYAILRLDTGRALIGPTGAPRGTAVVAELKGGFLRLRSEGSSEE